MLLAALDRNTTYNRDKSNVYASILALPDQVNQAVDLGHKLVLAKAYSQATKLIVAGMGGSALGGRVLKAFGSSLLTKPFEVITDHCLPAYADGQTLVILSSYSGNTEETVELAGSVKRQRALAVVVTTGGELGKLARNYHWPAVIFDPIHNPSNQPRMALGYNIGLILSILSQAELISLPPDEFLITEESLRQSSASLVREVPQKSNPAKKLSQQLLGKVVILIAAEHLLGAAHAFKNQLNENAKTFSALFDLPELNHHLLEGLTFPKSLPHQVHFVLLDSPIYSTFIAKRLDLTEEVIKRQGYGITRIRTEAKRPLAQVFEAIQFGSFVSLYLALVNKIDPGPIPWVDYFKKKLTG